MRLVFLLQLRQMSQVSNTDVESGSFGNPLYRLAIFFLGGGGQCLVPLCNMIQAGFETDCIEFYREQHRMRKVVKRRARFQLIKKPEPLLCKRERQLGIAFSLLGRDCLRLWTNAFLLKPLPKQFALLKSELVWSDEIFY